MSNTTYGDTLLVVYDPGGIRHHRVSVLARSRQLVTSREAIENPARFLSRQFLRTRLIPQTLNNKPILVMKKDFVNPPIGYLIRGANYSEPHSICQVG